MPCMCDTCLLGRNIDPAKFCRSHGQENCPCQQLLGTPTSDNAAFFTGVSITPPDPPKKSFWTLKGLIPLAEPVADYIENLQTKLVNIGNERDALAAELKQKLVEEKEKGTNAVEAAPSMIGTYRFLEKVLLLLPQGATP